MNIYIARHGQTNYNVLGLCNDDPRKDVYLTKLGVAQSEQLAKDFAHIPIDTILISQLPRTRHTARFVNAYHKVPIFVREEINDIRTGHDSRPVEEYLARVSKNRFMDIPPGGESLNQYKKRINKFIDSLLRESYENVLIITHEEAMRVFAARFNNLSDHEMEKLSFGNCEYMLFRVVTQLRNIA